MNQALKLFLAIVLANAALFAATSASANPGYAHGAHRHHGHHGPRVSLSFGPYFGPWGYSPNHYDPFFYSRRWTARPIIIEQPAPQVYIEQPQVYSQAAAMPQAAPTNNYWYFCEAAQAYWPYVKECPSGWQRVAPPPPPPPQ